MAKITLEFDAPDGITAEQIANRVKPAIVGLAREKAVAEATKDITDAEVIISSVDDEGNKIEVDPEMYNPITTK